MRTYFDGLDQGQSPSGALKKALAERCSCGHVEHDYNGGECYESGCKCRAWKVQGEPTDPDAVFEYRVRNDVAGYLSVPMTLSGAQDEAKIDPHDFIERRRRPDAWEPVEQEGLS